MLPLEKWAWLRLASALITAVYRMMLTVTHGFPDWLLDVDLVRKSCANRGTRAWFVLILSQSKLDFKEVLLGPGDNLRSRPVHSWFNGSCCHRWDGVDDPLKSTLMRFEATSAALRCRNSSDIGSRSLICRPSCCFSTPESPYRRLKRAVCCRTSARFWEQQ